MIRPSEFSTFGILLELQGPFRDSLLSEGPVGWWLSGGSWEVGSGLGRVSPDGAAHCTAGHVVWHILKNLCVVLNTCIVLIVIIFP